MHLLLRILLKVVAIQVALGVGVLAALGLYLLAIQLALLHSDKLAANVGAYGLFFALPLVGLMLAVTVGRRFFRAIDNAPRSLPPRPAAASDLV
jgi:hypothetical protein